MKNNFLQSKHTLLYAALLLFFGCRTASISVSPKDGSPGDVVIIKSPGKFDKNTQVYFGNERAYIAAFDDSNLTVLVPTLSPQTTKLRITGNNIKSETDFTIGSLPATRLWFSIKDNTINFLKAQPSNESFIQDKSSSTNKLMFQLFNKADQQIATGYVNSPTETETLTADGKGLQRATLKGEVKFSITVPAFTDINSIKLFSITDSTKYQSKLIQQVNIDLNKK